MRFALTEDGVPMAILREISLLKQLERFDHPNIVRYVHTLYSAGNLVLPQIDLYYFINVT